MKKMSYDARNACRSVICLFFLAINCFNMIEQFLVTGFLTHMGRGLSIISCSPGKRSINKSIEFPISNLTGAQIAQTVEECGRL